MTWKELANRFHKLSKITGSEKSSSYESGQMNYFVWTEEPYTACDYQEFTNFDDAIEYVERIYGEIAINQIKENGIYKTKNLNVFITSGNLKNEC